MSSEWALVHEGFDPKAEGLREALCTLGNGLFATRGAAPESVADDVHYPGTYVAGLYDRLVTRIAGREAENEDLVNVPNWLPLSVRPAGGAWFDAGAPGLLQHVQELDLRRGVLTRRVRFSDDRGRVTAMTQRRVVSMAQPHLAALETTIVAENWSGAVEIRSGLDGTVRNAGVPRYRSLRGDHLVPAGSGAVDGETIWLEAHTRTSRITVAEAARTRVRRGGAALDVERRTTEARGSIAQELTLELAEGIATTVEKVVALYTSRDRAIEEPNFAARTWVRRADGFDDLLARHVMVWDQLWPRFDIRLEGNERAQLILRLHVFHLLQTISEHTLDLDVGAPARGLHGEAYRGHIFWDEMFVFPFLDLRLPALTEALLSYRYRRLDEARWAARAAGYQGAMYPWQSGSDGREDTQALHLNPRSGRWLSDRSHRQRHIGIAIAHSVWHHYQATGDIQFLRFRGGPMLLEIARFWASLARYDPARERYVIRGVMGPDEYHDALPGSEEPGLPNNAYTNVMACWVICRGLELLDLLAPAQRAELAEHLRLGPEELGHWHDVSRRMFVPFTRDGIISQFEGWEDLEELDWEGLARRHGDIQRLDRVLEAEGDTPNRYRASKQADVLMLFYLLDTGELSELFSRLGYSFDPASDIPRTVQYYLKRTSHGSTLSRLVHSWVLARLDRPRSWSFFLRALESDLSDIQGGTTREGIHLGAMAGTVDLVQRCYAGVETRADVLWVDPALPTEITRLAFRIHYRGHRVEVEITPRRLRIEIRPGAAPSIRVGIGRTVREMSAGDVVEVGLQSEPKPQPDG